MPSSKVNILTSCLGIRPHISQCVGQSMVIKSKNAEKMGGAEIKLNRVSCHIIKNFVSRKKVILIVGNCGDIIERLGEPSPNRFKPLMLQLA